MEAIFGMTSTHLADEETCGSFAAVGPDGLDDTDETNSVLGEVAEADGPNLH